MYHSKHNCLHRVKFRWYRENITVRETKLLSWAITNQDSTKNMEHRPHVFS